MQHLKHGKSFKSKILIVFLTLKAFRLKTIFQWGKRTILLLGRRSGAFERGNLALIKDRSMVPHVASSPWQRSTFSVTSVASSGQKASHSDGPPVPRFLTLFSATKNQQVSLKKIILTKCRKGGTKHSTWAAITDRNYNYFSMHSGT